jgi:hypothetical protein
MTFSNDSRKFTSWVQSTRAFLSLNKQIEREIMYEIERDTLKR